VTSILERKTKLEFETPFSVRRRPMVARVEPWGLALREKGCRHEVNVSWAQIYNRACLNAADNRRALGRRKRGAQ